MIDDPIYPEACVQHELKRIFSRLADDPGDMHRVLRGFGDALNLLAMRIPPATDPKHRRLVWLEDLESGEGD